MAYYSHTNLAYDFTLFEEAPTGRVSARGKDKHNETAAENGGTDRAQTKTEERSSKKKNVKRFSRRTFDFARIALVVLFGAAVVFIVASIIHGQVQLTELNQEIVNAKAQLAEQQSIYTQLEMKVDSSISTAVVEDYAKKDLNMKKAANSQKEFVNLSEGDKAEVTITSEKNIFESIAEAFASLWS